MLTFVRAGRRWLGQRLSAKQGIWQLWHLSLCSFATDTPSFPATQQTHSGKLGFVPYMSYLFRI
jgi:hypothetical protein